MKSRRIHLKVALCALLMALSLPSPAQKTIDLQGHRGARGLLAENTLPSFALALQLGVTTLELDVVVTQDDVLVISHDPALNPDITRNAQGRFLSSKGPDIRQLTFEQLQTYDVGRINPTSRYSQIFSAQKDLNGVRIPRLKDLFELIKAQGNTQVQLAIETKITPQRPDQTPDPERFVQLLLQEIKDHGMSERVQILSFDWRTLQAVQKAAPGMPTVYITAQLAALDNLGIKSGQGSAWTAGFQHAQYGSVPKMIKAAGGTHWSSFWRELDAQKVREAQSLGLKVLAWTVNDREPMGQMLDLGVDGLVTDRPDIAVELIKARGIGWSGPR
jgi:glycerophosphoryl diester phosphodiesterase